LLDAATRRRLFIHTNAKGGVGIGGLNAEASRRKRLMSHNIPLTQNTLASIVAYLLIGALVMTGIKAADWLIPTPTENVRLLVCVADADGAIGECGPFSRFFETGEAALR
jgi:hypothetical protein